MMHVIAAKAVAFKEAMEPEFRTYQSQILANARAMADEFMQHGIPVVSGGTDNHLLLLDLSSMNVTGREASDLLSQANITVNKQVVPFDPRNPAEGSGIRIGTPAVTTRGMKEEQVRMIAGWIAELLLSRTPALAAEELRPKVSGLCQEFPIHGF
jgi:glycine hydroxymethyltransferase